MSDPDVLAFASAEGRILVSHDVHTMPVYFASAVEPSTALFLIPQKIPITEAIEAILLIWIASEADEWAGRLVWLPL